MFEFRFPAAGGFAAIAYALRKGRDAGAVLKLYKTMRFAARLEPVRA